MCEWERGLSCHRMAHCVLIRCYLQPSLSEAPRCRTFFSTGTDCTSPMCEWGGAILSPHGALRAYTVFLTAEPRRGSSRVLSSSVTVADVPRWRNIFSIMNRPHLSEVRMCRRASSVTAWRTACLYGVTYSRASPRLYLGVIFVSNGLRCTSMV